MMNYIILVLSFLFGGILQAQIFIQPCDPCDLTPLADNQVMMGKKCSLQVYSDANDLWSGGLFLSGQNRQIGVLLGRNKDPNSQDWSGSHSEHAGPMAKVYAWNDSEIGGFDFYNGEYCREPGIWFLIDYEALAPGNCTIEYYDHGFSWTQADPNVIITLENIPNVDFYVDGLVDMKDFMILASHWLAEDCSDPDWCQQTDINRDEVVDMADIVLFAPYWLWGVPQLPAAPIIPPETPIEPQVPAEPNDPQPSVDPNVIYSIYDPNGLDEIILETGESIRLYISKETLGVDMNSFYLEVLISNPYFGWIHNMEYDPNDPNNPDMAEILAQPRDSFWDYYGPGYCQYEGIQLLGVSFWAPIEDGSVASFVYTAAQPGEVVLMLVDYDATPSQLKPMIIHQVEPGQGYSVGGDPNETVEFLENIWNTSPELQSSTSWAQWQAFLEEVRSSFFN
jgi:hypothetical protein